MQSHSWFRRVLSLFNVGIVQIYRIGLSVHSVSSRSFQLRSRAERQNESKEIDAPERRVINLKQSYVCAAQCLVHHINDINI